VLGRNHRIDEGHAPQVPKPSRSFLSPTMPDLIDRPLWRSFRPAQLRDAARHGRAGGISVILDRRWYLLGDAGPAGEDLPLYVDWAIRAVESERWWELTEGPARGLVKAMIGVDWRERVSEWIERDLDFQGATARASFDCMKCGACCFDNEVLLDKKDLARLALAGRRVMRRIATVRGKRYLPLMKSDIEGAKSCVHLADLKCTIYEHRPFMCRDFPAGTEQCMTSREDLYGSPFPKGR
jgi:Fe-S-cluster containining protein